MSLVMGPAEFQEHLKRMQSPATTSEEKLQLAIRIFTSGFLSVSEAIEKLTAEIERLNLALAKMEADELNDD
jgi:polyhydroxyalkanoate synthesis regulator phasin